MQRNTPRLALIVAGVVVLAVVVAFSSARTTRAKGVEIGVETSREYGSVLVVDGGELDGFPLYEFSGD
ncbi:MAG TPA: hypothetical protein VGP11_04985, partial [Acidimicrobiales bacterium]|nr:hypothetical protein [Acidimicrobiales bacterium]